MKIVEALFSRKKDLNLNRKHLKIREKNPELRLKWFPWEIEYTFEK